MRLDLCVQQIEFGDGQLLLAAGLRRTRLLAASAFGDTPRDGARDGFGILQVAAIVEMEPIAHGAAFGLAHEREAATAVVGGDRGKDAVVQRTQASAQPGLGGTAICARPDLQAVAGARDDGATGQFADGGIDEFERVIRIERNLDMPTLAVGQSIRIHLAGNELHAAHMPERMSDFRAKQNERSADDEKIQELRMTESDDVERRIGEQDRRAPGGGGTNDVDKRSFHGVTCIGSCRAG